MLSGQLLFDVFLTYSPLWRFYIQAERLCHFLCNLKSYGKPPFISPLAGTPLDTVYDAGGR